MKFHTVNLTFNTDNKREYLNITKKIKSIVEESNIKEGMVLVSAKHITAGVYINDAEEGFIKDLDEFLEKMAPYGRHYYHHQTGEDNGDAHLKNILMGHQVIVPITKGELDLGTWQEIYYAEFDGKRPKKLLVKVMGE